MSIRHLFIGPNAIEKCISEIPISPDHPDFLMLDAPCDIVDVDAWIDLLSYTPILATHRYGLLTNAHLLSEIAITRLLDIAENPNVKLHLWLAAETGLIHTIHSRFKVFGGNNTIHDASSLIGCESSEKWERWAEIMQMYKWHLSGVKISGLEEMLNEILKK